MNATRGKLDNADLLIEEALVGGEWQRGNAAPIPVDDPYALEVIGEVPSLDQAQVQQAVDSAADALPGWAARPATERGRILNRWHDLILANREDLARIITRENGKPIREARAEIDNGAGYIKFYADHADTALGEIIPSPLPSKRFTVDYEPVGVCAAITPWNFPFAMLARKLGPALAAGCTVVAKPADLTPFSALAIARLALEAGVPKGALSIVTGNAQQVGEVLTGSPVVRKLSFTGSTAVGAMLAAACAPTVKRMSLELGGNAPLLVFDDADLDIAIETAMIAKFRNSGQTCIAANRIYVQSGILDRFLAAFKAKIEALRPGDGFAEETDLGPLIDERAVAKVDRHLQDALERGGHLLAGGGTANSRLAQPALVAGVARDALLTREETFGPLAGIIAFDTLEEGVAMANDTPFGLCSYVCAQDAATIARASRGLQTGMVGVNNAVISLPCTPFGGIKMSGMGREGSLHGLMEYLNLKYVAQGGL
ncbi:NAD-dependent succinate-semialdehyde dehydrogenase [Altererythrobacter fulvus]|uniref:NAD-dependent succinate-semialdehyde dehydrogenase n=1 Tax=Caenibius fulvus TaxID=2126012 RepID=UPI003017C676